MILCNPIWLNLHMRTLSTSIFGNIFKQGRRNHGNMVMFYLHIILTFSLLYMSNAEHYSSPCFFSGKYVHPPASGMSVLVLLRSVIRLLLMNWNCKSNIWQKSDMYWSMKNENFQSMVIELEFSAASSTIHHSDCSDWNQGTGAGTLEKNSRCLWLVLVVMLTTLYFYKTLGDMLSSNVKVDMLESPP